MFNPKFIARVRALMAVSAPGFHVNFAGPDMPDTLTAAESGAPLYCTQAVGCGFPTPDAPQWFGWCGEQEATAELLDACRTALDEGIEPLQRTLTHEQAAIVAAHDVAMELTSHLIESQALLAASIGFAEMCAAIDPGLFPAMDAAASDVFSPGGAVVRKRTPPIFDRSGERLA